MRKVKALSLKQDLSLYPRSSVDGTHVAYIAQSLRSGIELPPIIVDKESLRVIDGIHRLRATIRVSGSDAMILVIEKKYPNEKAMFKEAMALNSAHGRILNANDRVHCNLHAEELGISQKEVAKCLNMTLDRLREILKKRTAKTATGEKGEKIAIKRTIEHKAGQVLNAKQQETNKKLGGNSQTFYINHLIILIESDLINLDNKKVVDGLEKLSELIDGVLQKV